MQEDVIVIGGSFAGASAAMQLVRAQRTVCLIDVGQPRNRFAEHSHGFFGLDGVSPSEIREKSMAQLQQYPTATILNDHVVSVEKSTDGFAVVLASGVTKTTKLLILATGLKDQLPDIPGIKERWGKTVAHCPYCHGYELRDRSIGVIATSEMSAHQAGMLPDWGTTTYFTQGIYEPDAEQRAFLLTRGVTIESTPVVEVLGEAPSIQSAKLADGRLIPIQALFVGPKTHMASSIAEELGCEFEEAPLGPVLKVDAFKQTTVAGVFAAGDMSNPMQNATLASASGVLAGVGAHQALIHR